jgi:3-oxoacyl-[acyl-carrier protein] reductase
MDLGLTGKKALVLASSQGLGLAIATKLCEEGADVVISGRSGDKLRDAAAVLNSMGAGTAFYAVMDLSDPDSAKTLYDAAVQKLGSVDILVNNVGGPPPGSVETPDMETWRTQFDIMVVRLIEITNLCLPGMREKKWGRVLSLASTSIIQPITVLGISNTIRSALVGWSKSLSNDVAVEGITVNILAPGRIETERVLQIDTLAAEKQGISFEAVQTASKKSIPTGRYGTVEEFGSVGAFIVSEPASYVTGSIIRCDGGLVRSV